jgi:hypothetical protein
MTRGLPLVARLLTWLEHLALRPGRIQRFMLATHRAALAELLPRLSAFRGGPPQHIAVVGGGLFPRTALLLAELVPGCRLVLIDADAGHLRLARERLLASGLPLSGRVRFEHGFFDPADPERYRGFDLVVVPLAFVGSRAALCARGGPALLVHDWIWRRRGAASAVISPLLLKRLNLLVGGAPDGETYGRSLANGPSAIERAAAELLPVASPAAQPELLAPGDALAAGVGGAGRDPRLDPHEPARPA